MALPPVLWATGLTEDDITNPETIADPLAWAGYALVLAVVWVALRPWIPQMTWRAAVGFGLLGAVIGIGYLIGNDEGGSSLSLRIQGLALVFPMGFTMPLIAQPIDRIFAGVHWAWMAVIAIGIALLSIPNLVALTERIKLVPIVLPLATAFVLAAATAMRWETAAVFDDDRAHRIGVGLILALVALGALTAITNL